MLNIYAYNCGIIKTIPQPHEYLNEELSIRSETQKLAKSFTTYLANWKTSFPLDQNRHPEKAQNSQNNEIRAACGRSPQNPTVPIQRPLVRYQLHIDSEMPGRPC